MFLTLSLGGGNLQLIKADIAVQISNISNSFFRPLGIHGAPHLSKDLIGWL